MAATDQQRSDVLVLAVPGPRPGPPLYSPLMSLIDLRSDTVTKPSPAMRRAMAEAEVGDDVFGDDPTVNALADRAAELLGKEAGLFVASGTMGNLVAQLAHLARGQETIGGREHHLVIDEAAGHAVVVGTSVRSLEDRPAGARGVRRVADLDCCGLEPRVISVTRLSDPVGTGR